MPEEPSKAYQERENFRQSMAEIRSLNYLQAVKNLETVARALDRHDTPLDRQVRLTEYGRALSERCKVLLSTSDAPPEIIKLDADGNPVQMDKFEVPK